MKHKQIMLLTIHNVVLVYLAKNEPKDFAINQHYSTPKNINKPEVQILFLGKTAFGRNF